MSTTALGEQRLGPRLGRESHLTGSANSMPGSSGFKGATGPSYIPDTCQQPKGQCNLLLSPEAESRPKGVQWSGRFSGFLLLLEEVGGRQGRKHLLLVSRILKDHFVCYEVWEQVGCALGIPTAALL